MGDAALETMAPPTIAAAISQLADAYAPAGPPGFPPVAREQTDAEDGYCSVLRAFVCADPVRGAEVPGIEIGAAASNVHKYKRPCLWVKPDAMPQFNGQCPGIGAEGFVTAWCGTGRSVWNAGGKLGVYTHIKGGPERHGEHPTEKPRRLMAAIVNDFTSPGQTILDPFMGSGTTGVAAVQMERGFIGIEKDPRWFDIACHRLDQAQRQGDLFLEAVA